MAECIRGWLKDFAPVVVSITVLIVTWRFYGWQRRLARQQLRHSLYDRRMAIYSTFRELLLALPEKDDDEIKSLFRKATLARLEVPFLFEGDSKLQVYLDELCKGIGADVIGNIVSIEALKRAGDMAGPLIVEKAAKLGMAKLEIPGNHLPKLPGEFSAFVKLTDFSKP